MASVEQLHHLCFLLALALCAAAAAAVAVVAAAVAVVAAAVAVLVAVAGAEAAADDRQVLAVVAEQQLPVGCSVLLLNLAFPAFRAGGQFAEALANWHSCQILSSSETAEVVPCRQNQSQPFQQSRLVPVTQPQ